MGEPSSAFEQLPLAWQAAGAGAILIMTVGGAAYKFLTSLKGDAKTDHVILERADLADMKPIRDLLAELRPGLEKIAHVDLTMVHVDATTTHLSVQIKEMLDRMDRMEQKAAMAKEVRDEIARSLEQERRRTQRNGGSGGNRNND